MTAAAAPDWNPDEWEAGVEAMISDLAVADALPPSIRYMNELAKRAIIRDPRIFTRSVLLDALAPAAPWGEAEWTARDLRQPSVVLHHSP